MTLIARFPAFLLRVAPFTEDESEKEREIIARLTFYKRKVVF